MTVLSGAARDADQLDDYRGLFWRRPVIAAVFTAALLSLAGIPGTIGFIGKILRPRRRRSRRVWPLDAHPRRHQRRSRAVLLSAHRRDSLRSRAREVLSDGGDGSHGGIRQSSALVLTILLIGSRHFPAQLSEPESGQPRWPASRLAHLARDQPSK
mgnify:CR=1 FL=1